MGEGCGNLVVFFELFCQSRITSNFLPDDKNFRLCKHLATPDSWKCKETMVEMASFLPKDIIFGHRHKNLKNQYLKSYIFQ
jgi:hypothetical protein